MPSRGRAPSNLQHTRYPCYGTNVHPLHTLAELHEALATLWTDVRDRLGPGRPLRLGLWLPAPLAHRLARDTAAGTELRDRLATLEMECATLNAFPYDAFHDPVVKRRVYRPSWMDPERGAYTVDAATALAALLPEGRHAGTLSTLPLAWRADLAEAGADSALAGACLLGVARCLSDLEEKTGVQVRVLLEPEPGCALETTPQTIRFFERLRALPAGAALVDRYLGVCFDCCHQAVIGEDTGVALAALLDAEVCVGKLQLSSAPEAEIAALTPFSEPRYLHQTFTVGAPDPLRADDLADALESPAFCGRRVRTHFHVPVYADTLGPDIQTTRAAMETALATCLRWPEPPELEIETYTWSVLPEAPADLAAGIAQEIAYITDRIAAFESPRDASRGAEPEDHPARGAAPAAPPTEK